ncbi:MAG TPA: hemerythrin domain-containing protein [Candidatus Limnocylindrales bacterium]|nr:hemerythrin domain-containing protein [Candidatus Limnocylindrales bacterium]
MNAIQLLTEDHNKVTGLFDEYEATDDINRKKEIAEKVFMELEVHSKIEEEIFYPAVRSKTDEEGKSLISESIEEHQRVKDLIQELRDLDPEKDEFDDKFDELIDNVEHHVDEEESEVFSKAEEYFGNELDRLGSEMETRKEQLMTSPRYISS